MSTGSQEIFLEGALMRLFFMGHGFTRIKRIPKMPDDLVHFSK